MATLYYIHCAFYTTAGKGVHNLKIMTAQYFGTNYAHNSYNVILLECQFEWEKP
jgi:hypothetical protein